MPKHRSWRVKREKQWCYVDDAFSDQPGNDINDTVMIWLSLFEALMRQTNWIMGKAMHRQHVSGIFFKGNGLLFFLYSRRLSLNDVMLSLSSSEVSIFPSFESYHKYFFLPINKKLLFIIWKIREVALCYIELISRSTDGGIARVLCVFENSWGNSVYSKINFFMSAANSGQAYFWFSNLLTGLTVSGIGRIGHMIQA